MMQGTPSFVPPINSRLAIDAAFAHFDADGADADRRLRQQMLMLQVLADEVKVAASV